ncbi:hypothetical protein Tco_1153902 [Tanacetum coccineum]
MDEAVIKFDKDTITLRSGKSKIRFHRIPESPGTIERGVKNDIEPIALTMTVNRLVPEWEERIKVQHYESEMGKVKDLEANRHTDTVDVTISFKLENLEEAAVLDATSVDSQELCTARVASGKGVPKPKWGYYVLMCSDLSRSMVRSNNDTTSFGAFSSAWRSAS